jgi:hypothetical protein
LELLLKMTVILSVYCLYDVLPLDELDATSRSFMAECRNAGTSKQEIFPSRNRAPYATPYSKDVCIIALLFALTVVVLLPY